MKSKEREKEKSKSPQPEKVLFDNRIKRKNVLALNEKVAAIREYEKMPVYKRIGRMFHCSPDQIKRIVQQRESILKAWEQRTRRCQDAKTLQMKVVRVSMLGKAVYDWIRRMMYYKDFMITDGLIQKMALQFKSAMGLQNFFPHQDWCDKFRQTYNITENDSRMLKIGYTQGHSVQIHDVMKDVLSECTPDASNDSRDTDFDDKDDDDDDDEDSDDEEDMGEQHRDKSLNSKQSLIGNNGTNLNVPTQGMPQLKPMHQLVAVPMPANGVRMPQKVLVATPITPNGQRPRNGPMTMTIIPLATIAQPQQQQSQSFFAQPQQAAIPAEKAIVPPPLLEIKKEIKEEVLDDVQIKEEYISDEEEMESANMPNSPMAEETSNATNHRSSSSSEPMEDDEDLALSSLQKRIQNKIPTTVSAVQPTTIVPLSALTMTATTPNNVPQMPTLTRAPNCTIPEINTRGANKRQQQSSTHSALPAIKTCEEARRYLKLIEDYALFRENFRLIGLITRADEVLREMNGNDDVDVD